MTALKNPTRPSFLLFIILCTGIFFPRNLSAQSTGQPGPWPVSWRDTSFTNSNLQTPNLDLRVYYPATANGNGEPAATGRFPAVVFGHGFNIGYLSYENLYRHLAGWGYYVLVPDVQNGFSVDHQEFAREMGACLDWIQQQGQTGTSPFSGKIAPETGAYGHSMGGGAAALLAASDPDLDAVSGLAAAETNPSAIQALSGLQIPLQVISGTADNVTPEASNQEPMFRGGKGQKQWLSLNGAGHCRYTDATTICDVVSAPGTLSRTRLQFLSNQYTTAFFNYALKGDSSALVWICGDSVQLDATQGVLTNTDSLFNCMPLSAEANQDQPNTSPIRKPVLYPQPAGNSATLTSSKPFRIFDTLGREYKIPANRIPKGTALDLTTLQPGTYWIQTKDGIAIKLIKIP